jgi:hypothetical protein
LIADRAQPLAPVLEFALAIAVRLIQPVVEQPARVGRGMDLDTGPHPAAVAHRFGIATGVATHQRHGTRAVLVSDCVIKEPIPARRQHELPAHVVPPQAGRHPGAAQEAVARVRAARRAVVGTVRQWVGERTDPEVWAGI